MLPAQFVQVIGHTLIGHVNAGAECDITCQIPGPTMSLVEDKFKERFARWDIAIPDEAAVQRSRGRIKKAGWTIWFLYGIGPSGEYLDFYASHRMTDDWHYRIHANGSEEELPAFTSMRITSPDPVEDAGLEADYLEENRRVSALLEAKGFGGDRD